MQRTQFHAKIMKNDLKLTDFLKRNFYFETGGVHNNTKHLPTDIPIVNTASMDGLVEWMIGLQKY